MRVVPSFGHQCMLLALGHIVPYMSDFVLGALESIQGKMVGSYQSAAKGGGGNPPRPCLAPRLVNMVTLSPILPTPATKSRKGKHGLKQSEANATNNLKPQLSPPQVVMAYAMLCMTQFGSVDVGAWPMQGGMHLTGGGGFYSNDTHHRGMALEIHQVVTFLEFFSPLESKVSTTL